MEKPKPFVKKCYGVDVFDSEYWEVNGDESADTVEEVRRWARYIL